jgi:hypothetical protein
VKFTQLSFETLTSKLSGKSDLVRRQFYGEAFGVMGCFADRLLGINFVLEFDLDLVKSVTDRQFSIEPVYYLCPLGVQQALALTRFGRVSQARTRATDLQ